MNKGEFGKLWMVTRTDAAGNTFLMKDGITKELAEAMAELYTGRGHKQYYNIHEYTAKTREEVLKKHNIIIV
ncbi:MAG: hypothetical protein HY225_03170 [Candidatus Vogelbacteria bacterium]|nr:hypothetical protein [Candidatus Vogelbacteria bacterium]